MPHRKRHLALFLALPILLTLFATPAGAVPFERALPELFARGWSLVHSIWTELGCGIDPNGSPCTSAPAPILSDAGCGIDPDGGCSASTAKPEPILSDLGCGIDPHGLCGQ